MEYIRTLSKNHWDETREEFNDFAFNNSSKARGGGISVIDIECATQSNGGVCGHIDTHYLKKASPPLFWRISDTKFPREFTKQHDNSNGDNCHYNIFGISNNKARRIFYENIENAIFLCVDGQPQTRTMTEIKELIRTGGIKL